MTYTAERKQNMEEMYEVHKFIEHDAHCRQSMDCVTGTVLLSYLKDHPGIEKAVLFSWLRELAVCMDQYHRSHGRQDYRYLNPCSVVVSEEGRLFLLDMEAPDNERAMKQMQKRAVRSHFVRPVYEMGICRNNEADLFAYGRTIQFILAYTEVYPPLGYMEERRLSGIIDRCAGETKRKYEDFRGVLKDLPPVPRRNGYAGKSRPDKKRLSAGRRMPVILAGTAVGIAAAVFAGVGAKGLLESRAAYARERDAARKAEQEAEEKAEEQREKEEWQRREEAVREQEEQEASEEMERLMDEAIAAYGKVLELEQDKDKIREAGLKKMELEMQRGEYEDALATAETVTEKAGGSEALSELIGDCEENIP